MLVVVGKAACCLWRQVALLTLAMDTHQAANLDFIRSLLEEIGQPLESRFDPAVATLQQIGLDSLSVLELLMLIDERTGVEIAVEQVGTDTTLVGLAALIPPQAGA